MINLKDVKGEGAGFKPPDTSSRNLRRAFRYLVSVSTGFLAGAQNFLNFNPLPGIFVYLM